MHVYYKTLKYIFFIFVINEKQSGTVNTIMAEPEYKHCCQLSQVRNSNDMANIYYAHLICCTYAC